MDEDDNGRMLSRRLRDHWFFWLLGVIAAVLTIVLAVQSYLEASLTSGTNSSARESKLSVMDVVIEPTRYGSEPFHLGQHVNGYALRFQITILNSSKKARSGCSIETRDTSLTLVVSEDDWHKVEDASSHFALPADLIYEAPFFIFPLLNTNANWLAHGISLRVHCREPDLQISHWYEVDLRQIE
jgi:hypothetical protein